MSPNIVWTRRAEERLATALRRTPGASGSVTSELHRIDDPLAAAFREASHVIVLNYYVGFKHRPNQHILQVDVRQAGSAHSYVVKLADHERLNSELLAWKLCNITDAIPVFMPLRPCSDPAHPEQLLAIAYQDAERHSGAEETLWLETAIQRCVRFDSPSLGSILETLHNVYSQLRRLHSNSGRLEAPSRQGIETVPTRQLPGERHLFAKSLDRWDQTGPRSIRQQVPASFPVGFSQFLDPVDYNRFLDAELSAGPPTTAIVPEVLRGLAHGDLHGRNLLVGISEEERAIFPALFDYESFHDDNLIAWDFVEMETELKIRLYKRIFAPTSLTDLAQQVQQFEWELAEATQHRHETKRWTLDNAAAKSPRDRLRVILLAIREEAFHTLGLLRAESIDWLREYLFLLGCYGLTTVRYENQTDFERAAVYVSAGVAAAYLEKIRGQRPVLSAAPATILEQRHPTYQRPLAVARHWSRSKNLDDRKQAEILLAGLVTSYPTALHVWFEQAFNLTKQPNRIHDALQLLATIHTTFEGRLDEDTFSLWGRCHKDLGDRELQRIPAVDRELAFREAEEAYGRALEQYQKAYAVRKGFFPGINVCTLTFLRAGLLASLDQSDRACSLREESRQQAKELLANRSNWQESQPDDAIWKRATEAEAEMLCGRWPQAVARYQAALNQVQCAPHHPESMGKQLRRILDGYIWLNEPVDLELFKELQPMWPWIQPRTMS